MEGTEQTLVVILASALAVFLVLGIVAMIKVIQVLNHLKSISEKAEKIADSAESIGEFFKRGATGLSLTRLVANIHDNVFSRKNRKD